MSKPIPDKAEISLEYPDKLYVGTFQRSARFDARLEPAGISLTLERTGDAGERKSVHIHLHDALFAAILQELAVSARHIGPNDLPHRTDLAAGAEALRAALVASTSR